MLGINTWLGRASWQQQRWLGRSEEIPLHLEERLDAASRLLASGDWHTVTWNERRDVTDDDDDSIRITLAYLYMLDWIFLC